MINIASMISMFSRMENIISKIKTINFAQKENTVKARVILEDNTSIIFYVVMDKNSKLQANIIKDIIKSVGLSDYNDFRKFTNMTVNRVSYSDTSNNNSNNNNETET